jgi:hypothetical protein
MGEKDNDWSVLYTRDQASNNWILYREGPPVQVRSRYFQFRCPECGKFDEDAALLSGLDDVKLKSRCDVFHTSEDLLCFSERAINVFEENGIHGLKFLPLPQPNKLNHHVVIPTFISPVDIKIAGFVYDYYDSNLGEPDSDNAEIFCLLCHRPRGGRYRGPSFRSMILPEDPLCVVAPAIPNESIRGKKYFITVSRIVKDIMLKSRLIGVDFAS